MNKVLADRGVEERFEDLALQELQRLGFNSSSHPVFLQSFEISSLEYVKEKTGLKLVFLTERNLTNSDWDRLARLDLAGGPDQPSCLKLHTHRCTLRICVFPIEF